MAYAEKCPVCNSTGKYEEQICHGCGGKGWVEVQPLPWVPRAFRIVIGGVAKKAPKWMKNYF